MDKIKHAINRKSVEAAREGRSPSSPTSLSYGPPGTQHSQLIGTTSSEGYHPIYDEFKGRREQTATTKSTADMIENPSDTSNITNLTNNHVISGNQKELTMSPAQKSVPYQRQNILTEDASIASIRSGVIGFPEGERDAHASLGWNPTKRNQENRQTQLADSDNLQHNASRSDQKLPSHVGRDGSLNTSAPEIGEAAAHALHHQKGDVSSASYTQSDTHNLDHPERSSIETARDTDRLFPLAGGVIGERHAGYFPKASTMQDKEPVTPGRDVAIEGHGNGRGREALAGAAAAATAYSTIPSQSRHGRESTRENENTDLRNTFGEATKTSIDNSRVARDPAAPETHASVVSSKFPYIADTENGLDSRLHIPGEYPDPTPVEEAPEPSLGHDVGVGIASPATEDSSKAAMEHSYGRDTAIAAGGSAAGFGALAATNHYEREMAVIGTGQYPIESSPYSSKSIDPRVYGKTPLTNTDRQSSPSRIQEVSHPAALARDEEFEHHYGRDTGLIGATAVTAEGLYADKHDRELGTDPTSETIGTRESNVANIIGLRVQPDPRPQRHQVGSTSIPEDPASMTIGPHKSNVANILDPHVQPDPNKQKAHPAIGQTGDKHRYVQDAATVGGVGAVGYGAYEAGKSYDNIQPIAFVNEQPYGPTASGAHFPTTASKPELEHVQYPSRRGQEEPFHDNGAGGIGTGVGAYAVLQNVPESSFAKQLIPEGPALGTQGTQQYPQHDTRDAAVVGSLGAAGVGAYRVTQGNDDTCQPKVSQRTQHQRYDSTQVPDEYNQKHGGPTTGVAGIVAGGAATYGLSQHDVDKAERESLEAYQRELEQQRQDERKALDKQLAKEEKHRNKLIAAETRHYQKEERQHQKELDKGRKAGEKGEKKHHLFGFLHRDKKDKDRSGSESESPRASYEYPADTGVGPAGAYESTSHAIPHDEDSDGRRERNRLRKDPPLGHPARETMEGEKHQHMGIDGLIGRPEQISGDYTTRAGVYGAHEPEELHHTATEPHTGV